MCPPSLQKESEKFAVAPVITERLLVVLKKTSDSFCANQVSRYIVSNYRHNIQGISFRHNPHVNANVRNDHFNQPGGDQNQISISIIPSTGTLSSQRKTLVIGAQPSLTHMSKREKRIERYLSYSYFSHFR